MYFHIMSTNKPSKNLATEYYLFKKSDKPVIILWQNQNCVVIGRNQNAYKELNLHYIKENNIDVVRRKSGGGAVFHDIGNINFTFIYPFSPEHTFKTFTKPIIKSLNKLGLNAKISGRNDITIFDKKISGNAQFIEDDKILHHGTLLFDVNETNLNKSLNVYYDKYKSKGLNSKNARVTNICSNLEKKMSISDFIKYLEKEFYNDYENLKYYHLNAIDIENINKIEKEIFLNESWTYGNDYKYEIMKTKYIVNVGLIEINFNLEPNNLIKVCHIQGDFFAKKDVNEFCNLLINEKFEYENIKNKISQISNFNDYFLNLTINKFLEIIFD